MATKRVPRFLRSFPQVTAPYIKRLSLTAEEAATADTDAVHAAAQDTGEEQVITTGFTAPPYPRNVTATAGGTSGDIAAVQVIVEGLDSYGQAITETLPAFTVNTVGTVQGNKAFASVTEATFPAHDGTGATTAIGFGDKLGLPDRLPANTVLAAALNGVRETTAPAVAVDDEDVGGNTTDLNSALNGTPVDIWYIAEPD